MKVNTKLKAGGTTTNPVTPTSATTAPAPGMHTNSVTWGG